jgi:DNA-directed RNA polymerase specialized sigma subunit
VSKIIITWHNIYEQSRSFSRYTMAINSTKYAKQVLQDTDQPATDEDLWKKWKESGEDPSALAPLMQRINPLINSHQNKYKYGPLVNPTAYKAEITRNALKALQSYDPARGAKLKTHVTNNLRGAHRWALSTTNAARIPENKAKHIQTITNTQDELKEELGREPTNEEVADRSGIPVKHVKAIVQGNRKDIASSAFEADPNDYGIQRDEEVQDLIRDALDGDDYKKLFDMIYGTNGTTKVQSVAERAKKLGVDQRTVYRMQDKIDSTFKEYA